MKNIEMNEVVKTEVAEKVAEAVTKNKNGELSVAAAGLLGGLWGAVGVIATMFTCEFVAKPIVKKVKNANQKRKAKKTIVKEIKADDTNKVNDDDIPDLG